jgi:hypothetical protein
MSAATSERLGSASSSSVNSCAPINFSAQTPLVGLEALTVDVTGMHAGHNELPFGLGYPDQARAALWQSDCVAARSGRDDPAGPQGRNTQARLIELLADAGAPLDMILACDHRASRLPPYAVDHACRKPAPGMLLAALHQAAVDLDRSALVEDRTSDLRAARTGGLRRAYLCETGYEHGEKFARRPCRRQDSVSTSCHRWPAWICADKLLEEVVLSGLATW